MALDSHILDSSKHQPSLSHDSASERTVPNPKRKKRTSNKENVTSKKNSTKHQSSRQKTPPRIAFGDPGFENLSPAEKLNDPKYRELIYQTYPNEAACSCSPKKQFDNPLICQSGCMRSCCMKLRNPKSLASKKKKQAEIMKTYCTNNMQVSTIPTTGNCNPNDCSPRLRGGADIEQLFNGSTGYTWTEYEDLDYSLYGDNFNPHLRLEGGGGEKKSACSCSGGFSTLYDGTSPRDKDPNFGMDDPCRAGMKSSLGPTPSCVCLGKGAMSVSRGGAKCTKKPCLGIDCIIRAFKEAQDFVDSLGKVPGLAGLGLMDPSESPFFGRDIDRDYLHQESLEKRKAGGGQPGMPSLYCEAPCNTQPIGIADNAPTTYSPPTPLTIAVPGRTGIVREGVPALPEAGSAITTVRHRRRDEKREERQLDAIHVAPGDQEVGPCGEPKCKSRQITGAKASDGNPTHELSGPPSKVMPSTPKPQSHKGSAHAKLPKVKSSTTMKPPSLKSGSRVSERIKKPKSKTNILGGGGDRGLKSSGTDKDLANKSAINVSKRVMRYIYTLGDVYPGIHYGHKTCIDPRMRVPANMGWLWNTTAIAGKFKPRIGWRPGAIGRYLYEMLRQAKMGAYRAALRPRSAPLGRSKRGKTGKSMSYTGLKRLQQMGDMGDDAPAEPPTLHIHRKDGTYYVTMYPIKQETDEPVISEPMKPLQFKIVKNKDDDSEATSSTASDMEIEFSPPAALNKNRKMPDVIHEGTQVVQDQILEATSPADSKKKDKKGGKKEKDKKLTPGARNR